MAATCWQRCPACMHDEGESWGGRAAELAVTTRGSKQASACAHARGAHCSRSSGRQYSRQSGARCWAPSSGHGHGHRRRGGKARNEGPAGRQAAHGRLVGRLQWGQGRPGLGHDGRDRPLGHSGSRQRDALFWFLFACQDTLPPAVSNFPSQACLVARRRGVVARAPWAAARAARRAARRHRLGAAARRQQRLLPLVLARPVPIPAAQAGARCRHDMQQSRPAGASCRAPSACHQRTRKGRRPGADTSRKIAPQGCTRLSPTLHEAGACPHAART